MFVLHSPEPEQHLRWQMVLLSSSIGASKAVWRMEGRETDEQGSLMLLPVPLYICQEMLPLALDLHFLNQLHQNKVRLLRETQSHSHDP